MYRIDKTCPQPPGNSFSPLCTQPLNSFSALLFCCRSPSFLADRWSLPRLLQVWFTKLLKARMIYCPPPTHTLTTRAFNLLYLFVCGWLIIFCWNYSLKGSGWAICYYTTWQEFPEPETRDLNLEGATLCFRPRKFPSLCKPGLPPAHHSSKQSNKRNLVRARSVACSFRGENVSVLVMV